MGSFITSVTACCINASVVLVDEDFGDDGDIDEENFESKNLDDGLIDDLVVWNDEVYDDIVDCSKLFFSLGAAIAAAAARVGEAR